MITCLLIRLILQQPATCNLQQECVGVFMRGTCGYVCHICMPDRAANSFQFRMLATNPFATWHVQREKSS